MVSLTYRTQDLVKIDNESFELEHIFKCDRNILVLPHQFTKSVLGKVTSLTSVRQWNNECSIVPAFLYNRMKNFQLFRIHLIKQKTKSFNVSSKRQRDWYWPPRTRDHPRTLDLRRTDVANLIASNLIIELIERTLLTNPVHGCFPRRLGRFHKGLNQCIEQRAYVWYIYIYI